MFSLVVAFDLENNIGKNGKIPWKCSEDLVNFKQITEGHVIIMGRKTYESIGHALPNRINIVLSNTAIIRDALTFNNPWDIVKHCDMNYSDKKCFVIGGNDLYTWFLDNNLIDIAHITYIDTVVTNCDVKFTSMKLRTNFKTISTLKLSELATYEVCKFVNREELNFLKLMREILNNGNTRTDRTGTGTLSLFGKQLKFNLRNNTFPLITTRKMFLRSIFCELMLFIRGQTDSKILEEKKINIWKGNTSREFLNSRGLNHMPVGDMGSSYGFLFRHFGAKYTTCQEDYYGKGFDQLAYVIETIKTNPTDRRLIISLWDPNSLDNCPLPPCLYNYQFYVNNGELSCMMTQRSSDFAVAGAWNIATGSILCYLIATICNLTPGDLIWNLGDVHIYNNLIEQTKTQLSREPNTFPKLFVKKKNSIEDFEFEDLLLINYNPAPAIKFIMNV